MAISTPPPPLCLPYKLKVERLSIFIRDDSGLWENAKLLAIELGGELEADELLGGNGERERASSTSVNSSFNSSISITITTTTSTTTKPPYLENERRRDLVTTERECEHERHLAHHDRESTVHGCTTLKAVAQRLERELELEATDGDIAGKLERSLREASKESCNAITQ